MITGCRVKIINLNHLETANAEVLLHFYHVVDGGRLLPGAWSREWTGSVPIATPILQELLRRVHNYVLPREQRAWEHFPDLTNIRLTHVDLVRYDAINWGLAVNYHRLGNDGQPISGFDGDTLFQYSERKEQVIERWSGGDDHILGAEFYSLGDALFAWAERFVCERVLGITE